MPETIFPGVYRIADSPIPTLHGFVTVNEPNGFRKASSWAPEQQIKRSHRAASDVSLPNRVQNPYLGAAQDSPRCPTSSDLSEIYGVDLERALRDLIFVCEKRPTYSRSWRTRANHKSTPRTWGKSTSCTRTSPPASRTS